MNTWNLQDYGAIGNGVADDSGALRVACSSAVAANGGMVLIPDGTYRLASNTTIPASVTLWFLGTALLSLDTGVTLTLQGPIQAAVRQIFTGTGTIVGSGSITTWHPQWCTSSLTLPSQTIVLPSTRSNTTYTAQSYTWLANTTPILAATDQLISLTTPTVTYTGNLTTTSTGALQVPAGSTTQRPLGATGMVRYNSSLGAFEGYGADWAPLAGSGGGGWTVLPTQNTTSNVTFVEVSGIPATATRILVVVKGIQNDGGAQLVPLKILQVGTTTAVATTSYQGLYHYYWSNANWGTEDSGVPFGSNWGADHVYAIMTLTHVGGNFWMIASHGQSTVGTTAMLWGTGFIQLSAALSRVCLTTVGNTSPYIAGTLTVLYQ